MSARAVAAALTGPPGPGLETLSVSSVWSVSQGGSVVTEPLFWLVAAVVLAGTIALGVRAGHAGIDPRALWRNERDLRRPGRIWRRYARVVLAAGLLTAACAVGAALVVLVIGAALVVLAGALAWYWLRIGADWVEPRMSAADRRILGRPDPYPHLRDPVHDDLPGDVLGQVAELGGQSQAFEQAGPGEPRPAAPDPSPLAGEVVVVIRNPKEA